MAENSHRRRQQQQQLQLQTLQRPTDAIKSILPEKGPSPSQVIAVVTLVPLGSFLLFLAGITLAGTLTCLAVATVLFVIFSPILVPAVLVVALAVSGFLLSGAFGITALSSLSWMANNLRRLRVRGRLEQAMGGVEEAAGQVGQKGKEAGRALKSKAHEAWTEAQEGATGLVEGDA